MSEVRTWKCDQCGAVKGDEDGWWMMDYASGVRPQYILGVFIREHADAWSWHFCGPACLLKQVSQLVGGQQS